MWHSALVNLRPLLPAWLVTWTLMKKVQKRLPKVSARNGWLLYTFACFLFFVFLTFPSDLLLQQLVTTLSRESNIRLRYAAGDFTWWGGCEFSDLAIENPVPGLSPLHVFRLTLSPSLIGLFRSHPFPLAFTADLYGGTFQGRVQQKREGGSIQFVLQRLSLEQWPFPAPWDHGRVNGRVSASGEFEGDFAALQSLQGTLHVTLTEGELKAGAIATVQVPSLQSVQAQVRATIANGRIEVSDFTLSADSTEVTLQGTIVLRAPIERSGLNLRLTAKMIGSPPPALKTLLSLLPASSNSPGERRASIAGSLAAPVVR
jgi:type II secretion system protein N